MAKEVKHLAWKLNCYKVMTTCLPQSPTTNEKFKHGSPKSPRSPRISPEGKYIFGSPSENRRKKPSSSPSTPTTPTPPSTPRLQHTPATARKMQQLDESPKLQPVKSIMQQSTVQIQHAPPPQQQQQPQQRIQQQQHQPQQLIQHQMQPQTIQTKSISIKSGDGLVRYSFDLEVDYITERLIAVSFPSGGLENQYRSNLRDVVRMLKSKHNNCYVVFNLSRRRHDVSKLNQEVRDLGWPNVLAPPLERLCSICKQIETWMKGNLNNVVVLHCKGGRGPIGVVVSAFMNYLSITSGNDSTMDRHAMKRFLDAKGWGSMHPSQMRYIDYFSGLLTNSIQINSSPLFLHHAVIHGVPNYDSNGGCRPFLRVYQGMSPVYTSGVYTVPEGTSRFVITPGRAIPLRGDILLKCYHKKFRSTTRDTIFRCQFHTTAVMEYRLVFQKQELDDACTDARFPEFTKVELIFSSTPDALHGSDYVSGASFPSEHIDDPLIRWDSYEHFNDIIEGPEDGGPDLNETSGNNNNNMILDIPHSSAPDGSLYAQVKKTPSPEQSPIIPRLTNGDTNAPLPYVLSPDRAPQVHTSKDGGKRNMDYRERMALDELLKGITGEDTDGGIMVNNNIQWKAPPSPDNKVLHHEPVHTRRIVSVSEDLRHAPVSQSKPKPPPPVQEDIKEEAAGQENSSPSKKPASRKESSEAENPYAEITDAMQQKLQQNPNTNQSGPQQERVQQEVVQQEMITPVLVTNKEQYAPPMMNGGISVPRSVEQHNPTYEIMQKGSNHRTMQNGPVSQNGPVVQNGPMVQNGQVNFNPGQVNLNPGQINVPNGPTPMTYNQIGYNASPAQPYVAQMNGPVETPIVPNSLSRVTERTPYASRLENGPTSPVHTKYEPRPVKAREDRFQLLIKGPNAPEQYQPSPPSPAQVSPVSPTDNGDDDGLGWLRRQQDKLREKRERENGRPIVRESPGEPIRVTPFNASPKLRVRFEGDVEPAPLMVSPPLSAKREEPPSWLAQQQKLQDRQGNNITPVNQAPVVATEVTPVQNAMYPAPDHLLMTGPQDGGVSMRRGVSPPPLSISKDLERSISELGQMNTAKPAQSYVQRTVTTSTTREWEPHERPLNRQLSDLTHDRVRDPVYQRPADDQSPKVPATPSTPYDPVPPILTNAQLRNDGHSNSAQEQRRYQSRTELASQAGSMPFTNTSSGHASFAMNTKMACSSSVPLKVSSRVSDSNSLTPSVDSGYKSSSYQTLTSSLSGVSPHETSIDVTRYKGNDGSETTIRNTTERRKKTVQVEAVLNKDGSYHYPAIPITQWKSNPGSKAIDQSSSPQHQPKVNICVNPYEEVDSFLPRPGDATRTSSSLQKQPAAISSGNLRSPTSAFVPLSVSTSMGEHLYDTSIHSSSSSSSTSSIPTSHYPHHYRNDNSPYYQSQRNHGSGNHPGNGYHSHNNQSHQYVHTQQSSSSNSQYQSTPQKGSSVHPSQITSGDREYESVSHTPDTSSRERTGQSDLTPSQHLLKSAFRKADFLLSPSSVPSLSRPIPIPNERPKVSFHDQSEKQGSRLPIGSYQRDLSPEVEQPPRASSVPPTLPSYDWVMNRIRELRRGTNNGNQGTCVGSKEHSYDRTRESKLDSSQKGGNKVQFDLRDEIITSSKNPRGSGTNQSKTNVVQPIPQRPGRPQFENLATLPPKGNTRSRTPQDGGTLSRKHQDHNLHEMVSNNVPNRREEIEHWNNYGYSYNSNSMQQTGQTLPGPSASQRFFPTSPMQPKDGEKSPVGRHFHLPESRLPDHPLHNQQPARTEQNVRTLNKQTLHVEATNPSQSVTFNTTHPSLSSMHGSTPSYNKEGRVFTRSVSNSGLDELLETNNNNSTNEDPFSNLDDAVKMLSHWSNEIQKLSAPYNSSSIDANHNTHASLDNRAILSHHQLNNNNQSDDRINRTHFQTHQSSGGYHNTSQTLTNHRPQATSTPKKNFDEVDLHIDEPTEVDNIPRGVVADRSPNFVDRTPPATQSRPPRRTNSQSGYDSDTGIQQYYRPPRRRNLVDPGAEVWLQNPGGLPRKESEFWNRKDGLKSQEPPKEYDLSSSTESISGSKTPKFPVGPRAYANMTKTFIVKTGAPPHGEKGKVLPPVLHADYHLGPDQPLPLQRTMQRQDSFEIPPVPEPAARPAPMAEVHAPPRQPVPIPVTEPAREIQPTQPMFSERRVITVENRTEPSRQPMEWTPTPPAPPSQEQRYYTRTPTRPTPAGDESFRQLEYLESEPWLGRKPIVHSPHRPNAPVEVQPWMPPVVTTMSTTGPIQTVTNGVPQMVTTTQWRREVTHQQQPIEIMPITKDVTEDVEARKPRNILDPPPSLLEGVVEPPTVSPVVEARFTPRYVREVNAAPPPSAPLPQATTPAQPSVVQYQEQPPRSRAMEPPITEVRLHPVELGPIQVVPVEAQVIIDRKEQYPGQDAWQQAAPVHSPVPSQQYQAPASQPHQGTVAPPPTYGSVKARSPSPTFGIVKTSAPQASHGVVQNSPSSPVSYVTAPPASAPSSYSTVQQISPPMSYGTVQSTPQRGVMTGPSQEPSIMHQRVEVREITQTESVPVSQTLQQQQPQQQPFQQHQEPPILQQTQQQVQQDVPSEQAPVSPEQPSATLNERLLNQPKPPVQYPTFSDRHRKAAKEPVDDSLPNGGAGYRTIYDNRRQRSSLGK
nr:uncharacterized protein LOC129261203 isoform X1 [Lytechinus pictus]